MKAAARWVGAEVATLTPTKTPTATRSTHIPLPWPSQLVEVASSQSTREPAISTELITPAEVPRRQKNAPMIGGTITSSPAEAETESTAIRSSSRWANQ